MLQVWLSLADQHIASLKIDWEKTKKFAFNERSNPDDNKLGLQIVKVCKWRGNSQSYKAVVNFGIGHNKMYIAHV